MGPYIHFLARWRLFSLRDLAVAAKNDLPLRDNAPARLLHREPGRLRFIKIHDHEDVHQVIPIGQRGQSQFLGAHAALYVSLSDRLLELREFLGTAGNGMHQPIAVLAEVCSDLGCRRIAATDNHDQAALGFGGIQDLFGRRGGKDRPCGENRTACQCEENSPEMPADRMDHW